MNSTKVSLKSWQRRLLYFSSTALWLSGALWLYYNYFGQVQGDYGLQTHPAQPVLLEIHGAVAMVFLVVIGSLFVDHVPLGWREKRHRPSGVALLSAVTILTLTGWGLYYIGTPNIRRWTSFTHWGLGLASSAFLFLHARMAKRYRPITEDHKRPIHPER